jgi:hypothetical protein
MVLEVEAMSEGAGRDINPQAESTLDKMARGMTEDTVLRGTYRQAYRGMHRIKTHSHLSRAK